MTNFFAAGIDVTNKCTLKCLHCFNSSGGLKNQRMDEMSDEDLERMAYDVIDCRPVSICMCGGEPLLRKESIYKIANYSNSRNRNRSRCGSMGRNQLIGRLRK